MNPRQRTPLPRELEGWRWAVAIDGQTLYVAVNHDRSRVLEVFVAGPLSASVGLLASKMLRGGFGPKEVARSLDKVIGTHSIWFNQRLCSSPEQVVSECLRIADRRLAGAEDSARATHTPAAAHSGACPECGGATVRESGCEVCKVCSWSRCG